MDEIGCRVIRPKRTDWRYYAYGVRPDGEGRINRTEILYGFASRTDAA